MENSSADQQDQRKRFPWEEEPEDDGEPGVVARNVEELGEEAEHDLRTLNRGSSFSLFGARIPVRLIGAISVFVGVFVLVYLLTWAALGSIGLAVGLILAAIVAIIAVKLFASLTDTAPAGPASGR
jgi:hypothetical protein